jgi:muramoyltetrapeptide carboxypeptidase
VLDERTADLGIPRVFDLPIGHRCGNAALPVGATAQLDGDAGRLRLLSLN